jgi:hypothetical protein
MGVVVKGGLIKTTGQGSTSIGPRIPAEGLVVVIDPALAQTTSSAYKLLTPLTASTLTATSNITPGPNVGLANLAYPTGGYTFTYLNTGSQGTLKVIDSQNTYIDIAGDALAYLRKNVQNEMTILYWYSGFCPGIGYPSVLSDSSPGNSKFRFRLNASPSPVFPVRSNATTNLPSATPMVGASAYGASSNRRWTPGALTEAPFATTQSITVATSYTSSFGIVTGSNWGQGNPGPNQTSSTTPNYVAHPATQNPPAFHRLLPMSSFAGRNVYRDSDTWNCFAMTLKQTDKAVTSSIYINAGFFADEKGVTGSLTAGAFSRGSVSFTTAIQNDNSNAFIITGSTSVTLGGTSIRFIPTSSGTPADTTGLPAGVRNYYFASGSSTAITLQNLVDKINNTPSASLFFTASFTSPSTVAVSSSVVGGQLNTITFNFSSSVTPQTQLFSFAGGVESAGSGPITTTLLQELSSGSVLRVGVVETATQTGFYRQGLTGLLGAIYVYNRVLSQQEIIQFYNALKGRYGNTAPANTPKRTYRIFNSTISGSIGTYEDPPSGSGIGY